MSLLNCNFIKNISIKFKLLQIPNFNIECVRHSKHWNPKFKKLRGQKFIKVDLPDFHKNIKGNKLTPDEMRSTMKEKGLLPPRPWQERPIFISCTGTTFEPYVPPEGDGKISAVTLPGVKQKFEFLEKKGKSKMAIRKIKTFEEGFHPIDFVEKAQEIYIKAHELLISKDKYKLREFVTEKALMDMLNNVKLKTIRWKFLQSLEPPRVVHARCTDVITKSNIYGQVTVRFHSQQMLAVYDRFGRLMYGSEILTKDVLEYVVFEKHLCNEYGEWRIHEKIMNSETLKCQEPIIGTYVESDEPDEPDEISNETTENVVEDKVATT